MSLSFNDSGLVTRGMGTNNRMPTRGMAMMRFDRGGIRRQRQRKEYYLNLFSPIQKQNQQEIEIYSSLEIERDSKHSLNSNVLKEINEELNIRTPIDSSKLSKILDGI